MNLPTPLIAALRLTPLSLTLLVLAAAPANAAVCTWTAAGATSNFSDANNWDAFPTPDADLVFPAGSPFASKGAPVNDLVGLTVNALNLYEAYAITGNAITGKVINDNNATTATVALPLKTAGSAVLTITVTTLGATLNLTGILSGEGPVTYGGPGTKRLAGAASNTLTGLSTVTLGTLALDSTATAVVGPLVIASGATASLRAGPSIGAAVLVTVDGTLDLSVATGSDGADTETIGGLAGTGTVSLGTRTLGCAGQVTPTTFSGGFSGTGGFRQSGSGTQIFSGNATTTTGPMTLAGGELHLQGTQPSAPVAVTAGLLVLENDTTVGPVTLSGGSASTLAFGEGLVNRHGTTTSLSLGAGTVYQVATGSPTSYGTLTTASTTLTGATLVVDTAVYTPVVGQVLTILDTTGAGAVTGTFASLAEGATVASAANAATTFRISYVGGTGNEVTLTSLSAPSDTAAPVISAGAAGTPTATTVSITWTTDEAGDGQVDYGATTAYGTRSTLAASRVTAHIVTLSGLTPATTYHYRARSTDAAGNLALGSDGTFTTAAGSGTGGGTGTTVATSSSKDKGHCGVGGAMALLTAGLVLVGGRRAAQRRD